MCSKHFLYDELVPNNNNHNIFSIFRAQSWASTEHYAILKSIFEMSFQFDFTGMIEPELRRLRAGLLLTEILSRLDPTQSRQNSRTKISLFTTHDSALFYLMDALGVKPERTLKFGATLLFESYYSTELNDTFVNVYMIEVIIMQPKNMQ